MFIRFTSCLLDSQNTLFHKKDSYFVESLLSFDSTKVKTKLFGFIKFKYIPLRRYPDLNWGSRICNPLPYHLAIPPCQNKVPVLFKLCTSCKNLVFARLLPIRRIALIQTIQNVLFNLTSSILTIKPILK